MPTPPDPTATPDGLPIRHDGPPVAHRDVFDYVLAKWQEANPALATGPLATLAEQYTAFARQTFQTTQPIGMDYLGASLALRFQDGMVLAFVDPESASPTDGASVSASIIRADSQLGRGGKGATTPSASFNVTGNEDQ